MMRINTLVSGLLSLYLSISFSHAAIESPAQINIQQYDAVIIGGGLAGLATLDALAQRGITNVLLAEQSSRVGGKIWTERNRNDNKTPYYERGAELVNSQDLELIELIRRLGLGLTERRFKSEKREDVFLFKDRLLDVDGKVIEIGLRAFNFNELVEKMNDFVQDRQILKNLLSLQNRRHENVRTLSAQDVVNGGIYSTSFFSALIQSEFGVNLRQINAEVLLDYIKITEKPSPHGKNIYTFEIIPNSDERFRVTDGTDRITEELRSRFANFISTDTRATRVQQHSFSDFSVEFNVGKQHQTTVKAKHVIFAIPAYDLAQIQITSPELSVDDLRKAAALPFGHNAKIFLIFNEKFWDSANSGTTRTFTGVGLLESGVQFWDTSENQERSKKGVITLYPGSWPTNADLQTQHLAKVLEQLRQVRGLEQLDRHLTKVDVHNWPKSYAGAFSTSYTQAPAIFAQKLKSNIYFVGSDKDSNTQGAISESYGYMNGAVRTAIRAATQISERTRNTFYLKQKLRCSALLLNAG